MGEFFITLGIVISLFAFITVATALQVTIGALLISVTVAIVLSTLLMTAIVGAAEACRRVFKRWLAGLRKS